MPPLKGLLVDVGNVLIDERNWPPLDRGPFHAAALERLAAAFGGPQPWFEGLWALDQVVDGPELQQTSPAYIVEHLARSGVEATPADVRAVCTAFAVPLIGFVSPVPEARAALEAAQNLGLRMAVCSNTAVRSGADYLRDFRDFNLDQFFDAYITSLDTGYRKPHRAIFEAGLEALGTLPEETAMIGDRPERDIVGAAALGLRTIWVRPPDFSGVSNPRPDAEVSNLGELAPILERWVQS